MAQANKEHQDENLLSRWSRRKQQSVVESLKEDQLLEDQNIDLQQQEISAPEVTQPVVVLTDEDMPAIESLHEDSDFSGFMSTGVSDELRNLALKKLFKAPSFNLRDGLDEYDEDYTSFEKLGDIITSDMKHQIEMEAKKKLEEEAERLNDSEIEQPSMQSLPEQIDPEEDKYSDNQLLKEQVSDSTLTSASGNTQQIVEPFETSSINTAVNNE